MKQSAGMMAGELVALVAQLRRAADEEGGLDRDARMDVHRAAVMLGGLQREDQHRQVARV